MLPYTGLVVGVGIEELTATTGAHKLITVKALWLSAVKRKLEMMNNF